MRILFLIVCKICSTRGWNKNHYHGDAPFDVIYYSAENLTVWIFKKMSNYTIKIGEFILMFEFIYNYSLQKIFSLSRDSKILLCPFNMFNIIRYTVYSMSKMEIFYLLIEKIVVVVNS